MKKITLMLNVFVLLILVQNNTCFGQISGSKKIELFGKTQEVITTNGYVKCVSSEYENYLQQSDSKRMTNAQFEAWITPLIEQYKNNKSTASTNAVITIPVVVHVIHSGQNVGIAPNITDSQVASQITVMTNDFRKMMGTPGFNTNPVGADAEIQFVLAKVDPNGNPTNGIDRVNLCQGSFTTGECNSIVKPNTIWDPTQYLNMWSVNFTDNTLLGYAQFPDNSGLPGINPVGGAANTDGVVANYSTFGSINYNDGTFLLNAPYNEGRTMTHEVGHWVGLRHIWGDSTCGDDYCADTPVANGSNGGCPTVPNCSNTGNQMVQNYMDYTNDACMNIYTQNQKDRISVVMANSPRRVSLVTSTKGDAIPLFANDAEVKVENVCVTPTASNCTVGQSTQRITLYNRGTATLTAATLNYNVDAGTTSTYNWTGSLAINKFATFDMPVVNTTSGTIAITVVNANGTPDQRNTNNTASGPFTAASGPINYTNGFTTVKFNLKRDSFASQTTWNLKNSAGTILYSGGPYTNQTGGGITISQTWNVPSGSCYTFSINDTAGDGICCGNGNGFYNIKSPDGTIIIGEGGQFGTTDSKSFSINYLANTTFNSLSNVYLYPNPAKNNINIASSNAVLPTGYYIYNTLGQKIKSNQINSESDLNINTSSLSNGVYFITLIKDLDKKTIRFIKQ